MTTVRVLTAAGAAIFVAAIPAKADPVAMVCSGYRHYRNLSTADTFSEVTMTATLDVATGTLETEDKQFSIDQPDARVLYFVHRGSETIIGTLDRISGEMFLLAGYPRSAEATTHARCKPIARLF
jgi:hypothetical protein